MFRSLRQRRMLEIVKMTNVLLCSVIQAITISTNTDSAKHFLDNITAKRLFLIAIGTKRLEFQA